MDGKLRHPNLPIFFPETLNMKQQQSLQGQFTNYDPTFKEVTVSDFGV